MELLTKHSTATNLVLKIVTAILFITFPVIGFALGAQYQAMIDATAVRREIYENQIQEVPSPAKIRPSAVPSPILSPQLKTSGGLFSDSYQPDYPENNGWTVTAVTQNTLGYYYKMEISGHTYQLLGKQYVYTYHYSNSKQIADMNFSGHYMRWLEADGWSQNTNYAAGGVEGSTIGYSKITDNGEEFILLTEHNKGPWLKDGPLQLNCPCIMEYSFFIGKRVKVN